MENKDVMYHIGLSKKDIKKAKYAIIAGDPGRIPRIAQELKNPVHLKTNREYTSYLGELEGQNVLVMSHGIGGPSTAIAVEELALLGIKTIIRVGTSGGMQLAVDAGDIVIAHGAIRQDGTSKEYVPVEFPAIADLDVTNSLKQAADEYKYTNFVGVVQCKDSFYGQHSPGRMPIAYELKDKWSAWIKAGCLCSEMETATLFTLGSILGLKTGAVLLVVWNQEREKRGLSQNVEFDTEKAIKVAVGAIRNEIKRGR